MDFEIVGDVTGIETIATGQGIRDLKRLRRNYGKGRWREMKVSPEFACRTGRSAWPKSIGTRRTGSGKGEIKRKRYLDE